MSKYFYFSKTYGGPGRFSDDLSNLSGRPFSNARQDLWLLPMYYFYRGHTMCYRLYFSAYVNAVSTPKYPYKVTGFQCRENRHLTESTGLHCTYMQFNSDLQASSSAVPRS